jgi:hypothetical protein
LCSFVDHGAEGTGEPPSIMPRPGNAGSNTAADHITVARDALDVIAAEGTADGGDPAGRGPVGRASGGVADVV